MRTEFNLNDFNMVVAQRDKQKKVIDKLRKKNGILGALLVTSLIISGDLATRLYREQQAHEIDQARVEVLEVQAHDIGKDAENWKRSYCNSYSEYWKTGNVQIWDDVKSGKLTFEPLEIEDIKGDGI